MTAACPSRTSTSTGSRTSPMPSGATSSRTSTTPSPSSSGPRPRPACCRRSGRAYVYGILTATGEQSRSSVLILAFDTATSVATSALVRDGEVLGERASTAVRVLEDVDALLRDAGVEPKQLDALAVGIGPGSFTGVRLGLAAARGLALALGLPVAGVSTLAALSAGAPDAVPLVDAKRHELFTTQQGAVVAVPA